MAILLGLLYKAKGLANTTLLIPFTANNPVLPGTFPLIPGSYQSGQYSGYASFIIVSFNIFSSILVL